MKEKPVSDDSKRLSDVPGVQSGILNRRELLKASVASGAALAFLGGCKEAAVTAVDPAPCTLDWPPIGKDCALESNDKCEGAKPGSAALPSPAEEIEIAFDFMWCEFQKVVYRTVQKDFELTYPAIEFARRRLRSSIATYFDNPSNGATPGKRLTTFESAGYSNEFKRLWDTTAVAAALGAGQGTIDEPVLRNAWRLGTEVTDSPLNLADEGAEQAGAHMWFHFTYGVLSAKKSGFGLDVLRKGRFNSRFFVEMNVFKECVDKIPSPKLDMNKWHWDAVKTCCTRAGHCAGLRAGKNDEISEDDFDKAWCQESKVQKKIVERCLRDGKIGIRTSGCG